ncbi:hypothetical protein [uncultured Shewanella sp.]|uniref:hypothetical protein n=1 Tax=uncultured Shewanella sp. TaxID=173975 RepID=UPI0026346646|nr:hypothetical protein [uncultured Shewanella sp.]
MASKGSKTTKDPNKTSPLRSNGGMGAESNTKVAGIRISAQNYLGTTIGIKHLQSLGENFFLMTGTELNSCVGAIKASVNLLVKQTALKLSHKELGYSKTFFNLNENAFDVIKNKVLAEHTEVALAEISGKMDEYRQIASHYDQTAMKVESSDFDLYMANLDLSQKNSQIRTVSLSHLKNISTRVANTETAVNQSKMISETALNNARKIDSQLSSGSTQIKTSGMIFYN